MRQTCLFNILDVPEEALRKALPKASTRSLVRLVIAYPRVVGVSFMDLLVGQLSQPTIDFLREEVNRTDLPSFGQIRDAESELMKIIIDEKLIPAVHP